MVEIFKDIKGFEGFYQISNKGRVLSLPVTDRSCGNKLKDRFLKFDNSDKYGYQRVTLSVDNVQKRFLVHRLVAEAFIEKIPGKDYINHIDCNPKNNHTSNLEWCTLSDNAKHAVRLGNFDKSVRAGGKARAAIAFKQTEARMKQVLGNRFIRCFVKDRRNYTEYIHENGSVKTSRSDSPYFKKMG